MQTTTLRLYSLSYSETKTYGLAIAFLVGNIVLPQLCHLIPMGGHIWLPIYFFTLIGAYKYGWKVGLLTAVLSPIINHLLFGMPSVTVLPAILTKSVFLAMAAGLAANYFKRISLLILLGVIMAYQIAGTLVEWALVGDLMKAIQDFRIGLLGMLVQLFGGFLCINYLIRK